jgi:septum formation protein
VAVWAVDCGDDSGPSPGSSPSRRRRTRAAKPLRRLAKTRPARLCAAPCPQAPGGAGANRAGTGGGIGESPTPFPPPPRWGRVAPAPSPPCPRPVPRLPTDLSPPLILASGSTARAAMLRAAGVPFDTVVPRVDEAAVRGALLAEGHGARGVADALAEMKALRVSAAHPRALVLGADQVLDCEGRLLSKPATPEEARAQVSALAGRSHRLLSAAVLAEEGRPVWRHVAEARLVMRPLSEAFVEAYVARHWDAIRHCVGAYRIEAEGARLFERVEGDPWTIQGLPLLPLLTVLIQRGALDA